MFLMLRETNKAEKGQMFNESFRLGADDDDEEGRCERQAQVSLRRQTVERAAVSASSRLVSPFSVLCRHKQIPVTV